MAGYLSKKYRLVNTNTLGTGELLARRFRRFSRQAYLYCSGGYRFRLRLKECTNVLIVRVQGVQSVQYAKV